MEKDKAKNQKEKKPNRFIGFFKRIGRYFKEVFGETKKLAWPTRKELDFLYAYGSCVRGGVCGHNRPVGLRIQFRNDAAFRIVRAGLLTRREKGEVYGA